MVGHSEVSPTLRGLLPPCRQAFTDRPAPQLGFRASRRTRKFSSRFWCRQPDTWPQRVQRGPEVGFTGSAQRFRQHYVVSSPPEADEERAESGSASFWHGAMPAAHRYFAFHIEECARKKGKTRGATAMSGVLGGA